MNKEYLRKEFIKIRKNIKNKNIKDKKIFNKIINSDIYKSANVIALYYSLESEVNTINLIKYMLNDNKEVYLPRVLNSSDMEFYKIDSLDNINHKSDLGIYEPDISKEVLDKNLLDLIIIPGICFDKNKNRIGFGKGYYDNYLSAAKCYKTAIGYEEQILKDKYIITISSDIKLDMIITDKNIYK